MKYSKKILQLVMPALFISSMLTSCSVSEDKCSNNKNCLTDSKTVSETTTKHEKEDVQTPQPIAEKQTTADTHPDNPVNDPANKKVNHEQQNYQKVFSIMHFTEEEEASAGFEEVISDMGFYLMEAEDELKASNIKVITDIEDISHIDIILEGKTVKTIDAKPLMKDACCGFVVIKNNKPAEFIEVIPNQTAQLVKNYFSQNKPK